MADRVRIRGLHLTVPQATADAAYARRAAEALAQDVARQLAGDLARSLTQRRDDGSRGPLRVTLDADRAGDPDAVARAIARALQRGSDRDPNRGGS
ncbi:MAG: hypothetical protein ACXIU8_13760 [Alkalilacustris sp.]